MRSVAHVYARLMLEMAVANADERSWLLMCRHLKVGRAWSKHTLQYFARSAAVVHARPVGN